MGQPSGSVKYKAYYTAQLENGLRFQDFVAEHLLKIGIPIVFYSSLAAQQTKGESVNGIEVKFDGQFARTRNLYIEIAEKNSPDRPAFTPSGIFRPDNTWLWVIGDYSTLFLFAKTTLMNYALKSPHKVKTATSEAVLLKEKTARRWAAKVIEIT